MSYKFDVIVECKVGDDITGGKNVPENSIWKRWKDYPSGSGPRIDAGS